MCITGGFVHSETQNNKRLFVHFQVDNAKNLILSLPCDQEDLCLNLWKTTETLCTYF